MMKTYTVVIKEIVTEEFEIEAENENDAIEKGIRKYKACEWGLNRENWKKPLLLL